MNLKRLSTKFGCILLIASMVLTACQCSKSQESTSQKKETRKTESVWETESETTETASDPDTINTKSSDGIDADEFISFLKAQFGATLQTSQTLADDGESYKYWKNGFYMDEKEPIPIYPLPMNSGEWKSNYSEYSQRGPLYTSVISDSRKTLESASGLNRVIYFLKTDWHQNRVDTFDYDGQEYHTLEEPGDLSILMHFSFDNNVSACDAFKGIVDRHFSQRTEKYKKKFQTQKADMEKDTANEKLAASFAWKKDAKVNDRKMYELADLPQDIYSLNEAESTGHLSYTTDDIWFSIPDVEKGKVKVGQIPRLSAIVEFGACVSIELRGNTIVVLFGLNQYELIFSKKIYFEDWPQVPSEKDEAVVAAIREFGLFDPYDLEIEEDLRRQLAFNSEFRGTSIIHFNEIYLRRGDDGQTDNSEAPGQTENSETPRQTDSSRAPGNGSAQHEMITKIEKAGFICYDEYQLANGIRVSFQDETNTKRVVCFIHDDESDAIEGIKSSWVSCYSQNPDASPIEESGDMRKFYFTEIDGNHYLFVQKGNIFLWICTRSDDECNSVLKEIGLGG